MLRIHQCKSAEAAQSYFTQGLAREDYYIDGQEIAGRWGGRGVDLLGLTRIAEEEGVTRRAFVALTENRHPIDGGRLTQRTKADRTIGYDFNFHAPKGVSVLHAVHQDDRILETFRAAVHETMLEIERDAATRVRTDGRQEDRITGNLTWAEFVHLTARPTETNAGPDPHLHAHCFVFNSTHDAEEDRWKAAQFRRINQDAPYYEAAFHSRLAMGLRSIGYETDRTGTGWDLAEIERPLVEKYSARTREIESLADELGITDPEAKGRLGARTRKGKDKDATISDLRSGWERRLSEEERALLQRLSDRGQNGLPAGDPPGDPSDPSGEVARAVDTGLAHSFERRSSYPLRRIAAESLKVGIGRVGVDEMWRELSSRDLLTREARGQVLATTRGVLAEERAMLAFAVEGKGTCASVRERIARRHSEDWSIKDERLSPEQQRAVAHVLDSTDRVVAIRGAAGVGKTTMMREAVSAIQAGGQPVVVVAPTAEAARGPDSLRQKGFAGADTVARLLRDQEMQRGLKGSRGSGVLWVDEAGLLGVGTMTALFELAEKYDARVVLSGDERQHKPVDRGDALRVLTRLGGVEPAELTTIRRQQGLYREAVAALSDQDLATGVEKLKTLDAFKEIGDDDARCRAAASAYVETLAAGRTSVVISPTHNEGDRIAAEIRTMQRDSGVLRGDDREILKLRSLGWTEAERGDAARYEPGQVVHFHQGAKGAVAGDRCEVTGHRTREDGSKAVRARSPRGHEFDLPLGDSDRFGVYQKESMALAVGDRVRITKNGRTADESSRLTNGTILTVAGFTKHGGIKLVGDRKGSRPRVIPKNFGHLAYGSVLTSHSAQGKDVDHAVVVQSAWSAAAASAEQFYVSVSRGKKSVSIYTDNVDEMVEAVTKLAARESAIEMTSGMAIEAKPGLGRSGPGSLAERVARREASRRQPRTMNGKERTARSKPKSKPDRRPPPERGRDLER